MNGERPRPSERGPSTITDAEHSAVILHIAYCRTGRIGRAARVERWAARHHTHTGTGHRVPVRTLGGGAS